jgi:hypothetical protein
LSLRAEDAASPGPPRSPAPTTTPLKSTPPALLGLAAGLAAADFRGSP